MIDVSSEAVISLQEAAKGLPRRRAGRKAHPSCLYRWSTIGCRGVRLETIQIGGTRCTSREALTRFFEALTAKATGEAPTPPPPSKARRQQLDAARRRLAKAGI